MSFKDVYKVKTKVVVFDLEATCERDNRQFPHEIIEIGAISNTGEQFNAFVKPVQEPILTDFCKELTTIGQEDIDNASGFTDVFADFERFYKGATLISWGNYDKNQMKKDLLLNKINNTQNLKYLDENHINMKAYFEHVTGKRAGGMKGALKYLKIPLVGTHHRGIDDAINLMEIYKALVKLDSN